MDEKDIKKIENDVLFEHDRTCCVCRNIHDKFIEIHHIDGNHENTDKCNLAVLCKQCHTETLIQGGIFRKLNPELVTKYRDEWIQIVKKKGKGFISEFAELKISYPKSQLYAFMEQFNNSGVLPLNSSFYFSDYYSDGLFLNLVVTCSDITQDNQQKYASIFKAYLYCLLGEISPKGLLASNSLKPEDSYFAIVINEKVSIGVPNWVVIKYKNRAGGGLLTLHVDSFCETKEIIIGLGFLLLMKEDMGPVLKELEPIFKNLIGKFIEL